MINLFYKTTISSKSELRMSKNIPIKAVGNKFSKYELAGPENLIIPNVNTQLKVSKAAFFVSANFNHSIDSF